MLDSEKYARTQELAETARDFCDKVAQLSDTVATVVDAVDRQVRLASFFFRGRRGDERNSVCRFFLVSRRRDRGPFGRVVSPVSARRRRVFRRRVASRVAYRPRRFLSLTRAPRPCTLNRTHDATRKAAATEREKLRAVGKRNQAAAESERRRRDSAVKSAAARERRRELERLQVEYESLLRVKAEQEALIARMSGGA